MTRSRTTYRHRKGTNCSYKLRSTSWRRNIQLISLIRKLEHKRQKLVIHRTQRASQMRRLYKYYWLLRIQKSTMATFRLSSMYLKVRRNQRFTGARVANLKNRSLSTRSTVLTSQICQTSIARLVQHSHRCLVSVGVSIKIQNYSQPQQLPKLLLHKMITNVIFH